MTQQPNGFPGQQPNGFPGHAPPQQGAPPQAPVPGMSAQQPQYAPPQQPAPAAPPPAPQGYGQAPPPSPQYAQQPQQPPPQQGYGQAPQQPQYAPQQPQYAPPQQPQYAPPQAVPQPGAVQLPPSSMAQATADADGWPLVSSVGEGSYVVRVDSSKPCRHGIHTGIKLEVTVLESSNATLPAGAKACILRKRGGASQNQIEMKEKHFNQLVLNLYGYQTGAQLIQAIPDWEQRMTEHPGPFVGVVLRGVSRFSGSYTKQTNQPIYNDTWERAQ